MGVLVRLQSRAQESASHKEEWSGLFVGFRAMLWRGFVAMATIRLVCALVAAQILTTSALAQESVRWPTQGWEVATPESQGLDADPLRELHDAALEGRYGYIDRIVVIRNGFLVASERYTQDYYAISKGHSGSLGCGAETCTDGEESDPFNYYHPDSHPYFAGRDVHSLQSVTKSVASTIIGIALHQGAIASLQEPLLSFFPGYNTSGVDVRLHAATLEDLLTMRTGIEWHEQDRPFDETNTTLQLEGSEDWIQFTLDQPSDAEPGTKWVYNSGGSHLMSGVIKHATGMLIDTYAEEHLFGPLGIQETHWKTTPKGLPDTEGGLYLEAEDLAKIGYLYLQGGVWDGLRILSEEYSQAATSRIVDAVNGRGWGYGYQWWRIDTADTIVWAGLGFGGQYLIVLPELDMVGVVNSWNIFGLRAAPVLPAFLAALVDAARQ